MVFGQRLLAMPEDKLVLYNAINATFKGGIKPIIKDISMGSDTMTKTLYWRFAKSTNRHLMQSMEITDRDT